MPPRIRLVSLGIVLSALLISGLPLVQEWLRRDDIWWTPATRRVPIAHAADRVEIYARGTPLGALLERGDLRIAESHGVTALRPGDVELRFNNLDRVRAGRLPLLLLDAAMVGVLGTLFLLIAMGRLVWRNET